MARTLYGRRALLITSLLALAACGGGGGDNAPSTPAAAPTVTLSASSTAPMHGRAVTLSWNATNANTCTVSGGWPSGIGPSVSTTGTALSDPLTRDTTFTIVCQGIGGQVAATTLVQVLPSVTLSASPQPLAANAPLTITWSSTNAAGACTRSGAWAGTSPPNGSETLTTIPNNGDVLTLTCTNAAGSQSASVTLSVLPQRPLVSLVASPTTVRPGQTTTLVVTATVGSTCVPTAFGSGSFVAGSSPPQILSGPLISTTTFTVVCSNAAGSATAQTTVIVDNPQVNVSLTATPSTVPVGGTTTLIWSAPDATACTASGGWSGARPISGTVSIASIAAPTAFTLTCTNGASTASSTASVAINPQPISVSLTASPTSLVSGGTTTLSWNATNTTVCMAGGGWSGSRPATGSEVVGPLTTSTTYTLQCTNPAFTGTATTTVQVNAPTATVAGTLLLSDTMQTDSDVNDPNVPLVRNGLPGTAQILPNPVTLGGYANEPGAGPPGQLRAGGDVEDIYRVSLLAGQVVELVVGSEDLLSNDLDLELYTTSGVLLNASAGTTRVERLVVPASGTYFVVVYAFDGASTYTLSIGQRASSAVAGTTVADDFVPGEGIVRLNTAADTMAERQYRSSAFGAVYRLDRVAGAPDRELLYRWSKDGERARIASASAGESAADWRVLTDEQRLKLDTLRTLKRLARDPSVASAEPNRIVRTQAVPSDPLYARQAAHYELIGLPAAWNLTTGSTSVIVAVIDSGVRPHLDLAPRLLPGFDFVDASRSGDGDGPDADASDPGELRGGGSYAFHGTHVAGTIGAIGNNGSGVTGVAWAVSLMPLRSIGVTGAGTDMAVIQAIRYAAGLPNDSGRVPGQRADIINMSLGGAGFCSTAYQQAIDQARAQGVIVIAAAGNNSDDRAITPANCSGVVSVGAVDLRRERAPYSNFGIGPSVDVAAPGGDVRADLNGDGYPDGVFSTSSIREGNVFFASYESLNGTSMSAPHVAGVAALMKSVAPTLTPQQFDQLLASGALTDDIGTPGPDSLGVGMINAAKAVRAVISGVAVIPAQINLAPRAISFGPALSTADVVVTNGGTGPLTVSSALPRVSWLSVAPVQVDGSGLGTYRITVFRGLLPLGVSTGLIEFRSASGLLSLVSVLIERPANTPTTDGAYQYALLLNADTLTLVAEVSFLARTPSVPFSFPRVPHGSYGLLVGSDLDNDGFICDSVDACGAWPTLTRPEPFEVTGPRGDLSLTSAYGGSVNAQAASDDGSAGPVRPPVRSKLRSTP